MQTDEGKIKVGPTLFFKEILRGTRRSASQGVIQCSQMKKALMSQTGSPNNVGTETESEFEGQDSSVSLIFPTLFLGLPLCGHQPIPFTEGWPCFVA